MSKFKGKVGIIAVIAMIALVLVMYLLVVLPLSKQVETQAKRDVERATQLVEHRLRLHAFDLTAIARHAAHQPAFAKAIQLEEIAQRRKETFDAITVYDGQLKTTRRKADFLAVVDLQGKVIARDLDIQNMFGEKLSYASITHALAGRATSDIFVMKNRMMRGAAAPIYVAGEVRAAVVIAYDVTDTEAKAEQKQFNAHVVYFYSGAVRAGSFPKAGDEVKAINSSLLTSAGQGTKAVSAGKASAVFKTKIGGHDYLAMAAPLPAPVTIHGGKAKPGKALAKASAASAGYIVLTNVHARMAQVRTTRWVILGFLLILVLFVVVLAYVVAKHFVDAQDQLELGVSEVISGNMDYTFDALEEFEGLANALNVMLARLLGRPEPGEDEDEDLSWRADVLTIGELDASPANASQLAAEPEDGYYQRLHGEYIAAREAAGLSVEGVTLASFTQKVKANEAMLRAKHDCEQIRFEVASAGGRVSLKPLRLG